MFPFQCPFIASFTRRIRHNSNDVPGDQYQSIPMLDSLEVTEQKMYFKMTKLRAETFTETFPRTEESHSWVDSLPFEIPFGLATTFKSDEDWLDDWEEVEHVKRKPYTFDDRVEDYR